MFTSYKDDSGNRRAALRSAARALWGTPGRFAFARVLGSSYSLRCVVFHNISAAESPFTKGMGVSITPSDLEAALKFLTTYYIPVGLQDVLDDADGRRLPRRAVLVTFDDGYASVVESAAALCRKFRVPAVFFLNAAFIDNQRLAPDNLVCYVGHQLGLDTINQAIRAVKGGDVSDVKALPEVFSRVFPSISWTERKVFLDALLQLAPIDEASLAGEAALYLTRKQLRDLGSMDFEVGNHTYTHVRCRTLGLETFAEEIDRNKTQLEALTGRKVRSFSVPYGSSADLTSALAKHLRLSGHEAVFLSESASNRRGADPACLDRVSIRACSDEALFFEIEILPRLRATRNRLFGDRASLRTATPSEGPLAAVRVENSRTERKQ